MANNKKTTGTTKKKAAVSNKKASVKAVSKKANKTTVSKKPTKAELTRKKELQGEVLSIILIGLSLIMFICVISNNSMGTLGSYFSAFLIHCFGIGATVLPIVLFVFSVQTLFSKQKYDFKTKLALFIGFFMVFISLAHIMTRRDLADDTFYNFIDYYYNHASLSNGGLVGAITGGLLHAFIGSIGSYIVLITSLVVLLILATGKSFVGFINYIGDAIDGFRTNYYYDEEDDEEEYDNENYREPVQQRLPLDEMADRSKRNKRIKQQRNNAPNPAEERIIAFNLPEEENVIPDEDVILQNDFILENNKIYSEPKNTDTDHIKITGLGEFINKSENERLAKEHGHYIFNLPDDKTEEHTEEHTEELTEKFEENNVVPIPVKTEQTDTPPWEDSTDDIAKDALNSINKSSSYSEGEEPLIIEAEKTKTLNKLNVAKTAAYKFPKLDFLGKNPRLNNSSTRAEMLEKAKQLENTLAIFNVNAKVNNISQGPAVTRYELTPPTGVRVKDIVNLENDIALALAARSIRMEAPIPGKPAIGIEIPNDTISMVYFREVLTNEKFQHFKGKLAFGIGKDITGNVIVQDIAKMPHLLIAGSTGSGKSVCINTLITSILYKYSPDEVKLIMIDPKIVELGVYNGIPHLLVPVVTDPQKAAGALNWAVREMMRRYDLFATKGVRNLEGYNEADDIEQKLPQIVVIIDELADLMMVAKKDVEGSIQRLTQLARAAGIHLVIATQRPSVNVITGVIKANVPSRIAFKVASNTDSRTILDAAGAEKLLGKGDMLFQAGDMDKPLRIQGAFVTDHEVEQIVNYIKVDDGDHYDQNIINEITSAASQDSSGDEFSGDDSGDDLMNEVISFVVRNGKASTSLIQRKFRIGFNRAARIIDELEERGIVGPDKGGTKGRDVLMDKYELNDWKERHENY